MFSVSSPATMLSFVTVNSDVGRAFWYTTKTRCRCLFFYSFMGSDTQNSLGACWICCCRYRWRGIVHVCFMNELNAYLFLSSVCCWCYSSCQTFWCPREGFWVPTICWIVHNKNLNSLLLIVKYKAISAPRTEITVLFRCDFIQSIPPVRIRTKI